MVLRSTFRFVRRALGLKRRPRVAALRLSGTIGSRIGRSGLQLDELEPQLNAAFTLTRSRAVALVINSPGGAPAQTNLIAARIRALAAEHDREVLAFVEDVAASGGYWLAMSADRIYADRSSIIGSIGVVSGGFGFPEALDRVGIERRLHTAGERKVILDPFLPERPEDVAYLCGILSSLHEAFKDAVRDRRAGRLRGSEDELFSGAFWTATDALERGLIDGVGHMHAVLRERFGDEVEIVPIRRRQPLFGRMMRISAAGRSEGAAVAAVTGAIAAIEERVLWSRYGL